MVEIMSAVAAHGLDAAEQRVLSRLVSQFQRHQSSNDLRSLYYLGKHSLRAAGKLGMAMPSSLGKLETVLGWPAKAVSTLEHRLDVRGFVLPNTPDRDEGLAEISAANQLDIEMSMTHTASLIHGTAFTTVSAGDVQSGEPPVIIASRSAREATALWSRRTRQITAGLTVNPAEGDRPGQLVMWLPHVVITVEAQRSGWGIVRQPHSLGRVPMELMSFRPHLEREFGVPRITDSVMGLTDSAVRTVLRMEGTAEFFSFPQRYALGVSSEDFSDTFKNYLNRFLALGRDGDGELPQMGEFTSSSPQPHIEQLRATAMLFSGETSIPLNYLGIVHDQPASADAIRAMEADLITVAERAQRVYGVAWAQTMMIAQHVRDGEANPEMRRLAVQWRDPATPTKAANAQSVMSLVAAKVLPAQSRVTWELLGYDEATISRLEAAAAQERVSERMGALAGFQPPGPSADGEGDVLDGVGVDQVI